MDQSFKGDDINRIGKVESLGVNYKKDLEMRDYADMENADEAEPKGPSKFIQEQQRKKKLDEQMNKEKHLLP